MIKDPKQEKKVVAAPKEPKQKEVKTPQLLRGFKDILPIDQAYWKFVRDTVESFVAGYGYSEIGLPLLEETSLFVRAVGKQTDIVEKEMFTFADHDGSVTIRPEATASAVRAYINHGMLNMPQPVKLFYSGPMFRREKPQAGRQRQFHQFGFEVIGDQNPVIDAQMIGMTYMLFQQLGLKDVSIQLNSIGCPDCRKHYKEELVSYYKSKRRILCEDCKKRLVKNPLRLLDCKQPQCQALRAEAPQIVDWLDEGCKTHFMKVIEYIDELDIPYVLNPFLVRGLDYYTKTVFEILPSENPEGSQSSLGGGGRYDGLVEILGGRPTPAAGFACGIERIILELKQKQVVIPQQALPKIFLAQIGDQAKVKAMILFDKLRQDNIPVGESFAKDSLKAQLELANKMGARYVLIMGQKEVLDGTVLIRDMESGVQEVVDFNKTVGEVKKKLAVN